MSDYLVLPVDSDDHWVICTLGGRGRKVLSVSDEDVAEKAVKALRMRLADLPHLVAHVQADLLGHPELVNLDYDTDFDVWADLSSGACALDLSGLVRRSLDTGTVPEGVDPSTALFFLPMSHTNERLGALPADVAAAVKDEVVHRFTAYDGVPLFVAAYDYKNGEAMSVLSVGPVMTADIAPQRAEELVYLAGTAQGADVADLESVAGRGHLSARMNLSMLIAWHDAHRLT